MGSNIGGDICNSCILEQHTLPLSLTSIDSEWKINSSWVGCYKVVISSEMAHFTPIAYLHSHGVEDKQCLGWVLICSFQVKLHFKYVFGNAVPKHKTIASRIHTRTTRKWRLQPSHINVLLTLKIP